MPLEGMVHVVDDDEAMRQSLAFLFRSAEVPVRTYGSAAEFLAAVPNVTSGCLVTDVRMPEMSGIELMRRLREMNVTIPVVVITGHGDVPLAVQAMKSGASDFLEKPFSDDVLLAAVQSALSGQRTEREQQSARGRIGEHLGRLTGREREVLDGLVAGHQNKVIAHNLGISPRTVEIYRANVMTKMEANSLSDLVRMALVGGLLDRSG